MHFVGMAEGPDSPDNFTASRDGWLLSAALLRRQFCSALPEKMKAQDTPNGSKCLSWLSPRGEDDPRTLQADLHRELASGPLEGIAEQGGSTFSADCKGSSKWKGGTAAGRRHPCSNGAEDYQHYHCHLLPFLSLSACPWKSYTGTCYQQSILGRWGKIVLRWKVLTVASITSLVKANRCPTHPLSRLNRRCN